MELWRFILRVGLCCLLLGPGFAHMSANPASALAGRIDIREAQRTLAVLGLDPGPADGVLGPRTKAALTRFQQAEGVRPSGVLDAETKSRLADRRRDHVRKVQQALKASGYDPGPLDGVMGGQTRAALRRYAAAPTPSPPRAGSQLIEQFRQLYRPELPQSP